MTLRLLLLASSNWPRLDGWASARGVDAADMDVDRFSNLVAHWATESAASEADVKKFESRLWMPPPGVVPSSGPWSPQAQRSSFASLKAALGK